MRIQKQMGALYALEFFSAFGLAQAIWVVLLVGRGFTLVQVGAAEGLYHLVSFTCEVPSGMAADLLGRRRTLIAANCLRLGACLAMIGAAGFGGVCLSFGLLALAHNLVSGTKEALTYDSLLCAGQQSRYETVAARQSTIWRATGAVCALCTGLAVFLGWRGAYMADAASALVCVLLSLCVEEPVVTRAQAARSRFCARQLPGRLAAHFQQSLGFLVKNPGAAFKMLADGACGCCAYLCTMLLQQHLAALGLPAAALGLPLLLISLAGAAGAALAPRLRLGFRPAAVLCMLGVAVGVMLSGTALVPLAVLGGVIATGWDGVLEVKMTARLNREFPSDQRATLVSVQSLCYSMMMLPASPLMGAVCERAGLGAGLKLAGLGLALAALLGFGAQRAARRAKIK